MKLTTSSLFCEPGYKFLISHKISLLIRNLLNEKVLLPKGFDKIQLNTALNLIVSTDSNTTYLSVKGPDYNKREEIINWGLWLPYLEIVEARDTQAAYLKFYFDAAVKVLNYYNIEEELIRQVQQIVEAEVVGNPEYTFQERKRPQRKSD